MASYETDTAIAGDPESTDQDDLNVSNLLVDKSERAPATETQASPVPAAGVRTGDSVINTILGGVAALIVLALFGWMFRGGRR